MASTTARAQHPPLISGVCRICGCTQGRACVMHDVGGDSSTCSWVDVDRTLCSNPRCVAEISIDELEEMAVASARIKERARGERG